MGILRNHEFRLQDHGAERGFLVPVPARVRLSADRPRLRIRQATRPTELRFVAWQLFLVFFALTWVFKIQLEHGGGLYGVHTHGLHYQLPSCSITPETLSAVAQGTDLLDRQGFLVIDARADTLVALTVRADGACLWDARPMDIAAREWPAARPRGRHGEVIILVTPDGDAAYQQVVTAMDWIARHNRRSEAAVWIPFLVSTRRSSCGDRSPLTLSPGAPTGTRAPYF